MITKEEILNDPNIPDNYVDRTRGWVNEAFLDGIDYAERKLAKSPWIKFKDRKPEISHLNCVIVNQGENVFIAHLDYCSGGGLYWNMYGHGSMPVSEDDKWMPIPKLEEE